MQGCRLKCTHLFLSSGISHWSSECREKEGGQGLHCDAWWYSAQITPALSQCYCRLPCSCKPMKSLASCRLVCAPQLLAGKREGSYGRIYVSSPGQHAAGCSSFQLFPACVFLPVLPVLLGMPQAAISVTPLTVPLLLPVMLVLLVPWPW